MVITGISLLVKNIDRVDKILATREAGESLPFALPHAPIEFQIEYHKPMIEFFRSDEGKLILEVYDIADKFRFFEDNYRTTPFDEQILDIRGGLVALYFESTGIRPKTHGPDVSSEQRQDSRRIGRDRRLADYIVESARVSRNPVVVSMLLLMSDTLLEFAGQNASIFISHPRKRAVIETLLNEFALKGDWEDQGFVSIFRRMLGSTLIAFGDNPGQLEHPGGLKVLFAALNQLRESTGEEEKDLVSVIISADGFEKLMVAVATEAANNPSFLTRDQQAQDMLTLLLKRVAAEIPELKNDRKALTGLVQVSIGAATSTAAALLDSRAEGQQPLITDILVGVLRKVSDLGQSDQLVSQIISGDIIGPICQVALLAVSKDPRRFTASQQVADFTSGLVTGIAGIVGSQNLRSIWSDEVRRTLLTETLSVLGRYPGLLGSRHEFTLRLISSLYQAGAGAIADGLERRDLVELVEAVLQASSSNVALLKLDHRFTAAVESAGRAIAAVPLSSLIDKEGRKRLIKSSLQAIIANPVVWGKLQDNEMIEPLIKAMLAALTADRSGFISGSVFVDSAARMMQVMSRKGLLLFRNEVEITSLGSFLEMVVLKLEAETGLGVDGESLPHLLERATIAILDQPKKFQDDPQSFLVKMIPQIITDVSNIWLKV